MTSGFRLFPSLSMTLATLMASCFLLSCQTAQVRRLEKERVVTFLHINDAYEIAPVENGKRGGLARVSFLQSEIRKQALHTLFVLSGDFLFPSLLSDIFEGKQMVDVLNSAGLDLAIFGNHEFDLGLKVLMKRVRESRFGYTVANVVDRKTQRPLEGVPAWVMRDLGGVKVAVFGLLTQDTYKISKPGLDEEIEIRDPIETGLSVTRLARKDGADLVVAITHLSIEEDMRLAREVGDLDLILGGHDHALIESVVGRTPILKMGSDARYLGKVDLHLLPCEDWADHQYCLTSTNWVPLVVDQQIQEHVETGKLVAQFQRELKTWSTPIGKTLVPLNAKTCESRSRETNLGNFVADIFREKLGANIGLVNGGSIRTDSVFPVGNLTKIDVHKILAFKNPIVKLRLTGRQLKQVIEHALGKVPGCDGRFPQLSGATLRYRSDQPAGSRIVDLVVEGKALDEGRTYSIAVSSFLAEGGDGYPLKGSEVQISREIGWIDQRIMEEALKKRKIISPKVEKRIVDVTAPSAVHE